MVGGEDRPLHRPVAKLGGGSARFRPEARAVRHVAALAAEHQVCSGHLGLAAADGLPFRRHRRYRAPGRIAGGRRLLHPARRRIGRLRPRPRGDQEQHQEHPAAQPAQFANRAVPRICPPLHVPAFLRGLPRLVRRRPRRNLFDHRLQARRQLPPRQSPASPGGGADGRPQFLGAAAADQHQQARHDGHLRALHRRLAADPLSDVRTEPLGPARQLPQAGQWRH